jgi:general secretion pathway protein G
VVGRLRRQRGFSRFELAVAIAIFTALGGVLLERFQYYQEYAEKTAMEMTVTNIRAGLRLKVADLLMADRVSEIPTLADENPIVWLEKKPENYLGELDGEPVDEPRGKWYFDKLRHELVYTADIRRHFAPADGSDFTARYRVGRMSAGKHDADVPGAAQQWVAVLPANDFRWFE